MTDIVENSETKTVSSLAFINTENLIIENNETPPDKEENEEKEDKRSQYESELKLNNSEKSLIKPPTDEYYRIFQTSLFIMSVFGLSYHAFRYGRTEYNLLEKGRSPNGFLATQKKVITVILGYSIPFSILSSIAALMLTYSLLSKKPHWSLPSIIISMSDLVCDVGDALMAMWLFFTNLSTPTAFFYTACTLSIVLGELWTWLGVLRLYESRAFA